MTLGLPSRLSRLQGAASAVAQGPRWRQAPVRASVQRVTMELVSPQGRRPVGHAKCRNEAV